MRFELSEEQQLIRDSVAEFLERRCPPARVRAIAEDGAAFDPELWAGLAEQRYLGVNLPESCGGMDLSPVELAVIAEEIGRACMPGPFLSTVWGAGLLRGAGRESLLADLAQGKTRVAVAHLEAGGDWDPASVRATARRDGDGWVLDGRKVCVMDAGAAEHIVATARGEDGSLLIAAVPRDARGLTVGATPGIDLTRPLGELTLERVRVSSRQVVASGESADRALAEATRTATVAACADLVGVMRWMLDATVVHAKRREQFGRPIGTFQAVQHLCADMLLLLEGSWSATYYAAWALGEREPDAARAVSIAKAYVSDAAREVGNRAHQVHGGIGFTWEHDLHLYFRRAKLGEHLFGDATYHRERVAPA
jgi:alkylation response protein AidB-like acyl-CoA dehydrogenase